MQMTRQVVERVRSNYGDAFHTAHLEVPGEMFRLAMEAQKKVRRPLVMKPLFHEKCEGPAWKLWPIYRMSVCRSASFLLPLVFMVLSVLF